MDKASQIQLAAIAGAAGSALVLLARERLALLAGFVMLAVAEVGLGLALVSADDLESALAGPLRLAALVVTGGALVGIAILFVRFPALVPVALVAVAPVRILVEVGSEEAFLLVPLYAVLAAACAALVAGVLTGREVVVLPLLLSVPAALVVALAGVSALWSVDVEAGGVDLLFYYFPFALLVGIVARAPLAPWLAPALSLTLVAVAVVLAAVGLWERWTRELVLARDLEVGNAYETFYRTASLLRDPSMYGRLLVVGMLVVLVALWLTRLNLLLGTAILAFLATALFFTYSQSSMVALVVGTLFIVAVAGTGRYRAVVLAGAVCPLLVAGAVLASVGREESLRNLTSGRSDLAANAVDIAQDNPLAGVGVGGEEQASEELGRRAGRLAKASHTTPLTVAAEFGALGLAAYAVFLAVSARLFQLAVARDRLLGLGAAVIFLAVFVHSLFYSGFFEDPLVWLALGVAVIALRAPEPLPEPQPRPAPATG